MRTALVVSVGTYDHAVLLPRPIVTAWQVDALVGVLADPAKCGFQVRTVINPDSDVLADEIGRFLAERSPEDVVLVYLACQGLNDESGEQYIAARNSDQQFLAGTAVSSEHLRTALGHCRARRVILLLDSDLSLARDLLDLPLTVGVGGRSRVVISGGGSSQWEMEAKANEPDATPKPSGPGGSEFTSALISGLGTGAADRNGDGQVTVDELYDYLSDRMRQVSPHTAPTKTSWGEANQPLALSRAILATPPAQTMPGPVTAEPTSSATVPAEIPYPRHEPVSAPPRGGSRSRPSSRRRTRRGSLRSGQASALVQVIESAVRDVVTPGRLLFNPPSEMRQGHTERIEVGVSRSHDLDDQIRASLKGRGIAQSVDIDTSPFMAVQLVGTSFEVTPLSPTEQLVVPIARWQFDVCPQRAGTRTLQLCVSLRIALPDRPDERVAVPVLERDIHVRINPAYGTRRFITAHWQWIVGTAAGLGAAIGAWTQVIQR